MQSWFWPKSARTAECPRDDGDQGAVDMLAAVLRDDGFPRPAYTARLWLLERWLVRNSRHPEYRP